VTRPQQPEAARSGRGDVDEKGKRISREVDRGTSGTLRSKKQRTGPVPPENRPRHKPHREQDKPKQ
jgi:hypothetical protein